VIEHERTHDEVWRPIELVRLVDLSLSEDSWRKDVPLHCASALLGTEAIASGPS
jgi:hypothetical protein